MFFAIIAAIATILSLVLGLTVGVNVMGFTDGAIFRYIANTLLVMIIVNIVCAVFFQSLVNKIHPFKDIYRVGKWEQKMHLKLGVRLWKDKIPELGKVFAGYDKSKVGDMKDNKNVEMFIRNTIVAEYDHAFSAILGSLAIFVCLPVWHIVGLPLVFANLAINLMPVIVQRYNRPKLMMLYARNERLAKNSDKVEG